MSFNFIVSYSIFSPVFYSFHYRDLLPLWLKFIQVVFTCILNEIVLWFSISDNLLLAYSNINPIVRCQPPLLFRDKNLLWRVWQLIVVFSGILQACCLIEAYYWLSSLNLQVTILKEKAINMQNSFPNYFIIIYVLLSLCARNSVRWCSWNKINTQKEVMSSVFETAMLIAWYWLWWERLHHKNQQRKYWKTSTMDWIFKCISSALLHYQWDKNWWHVVLEFKTTFQFMKEVLHYWWTCDIPHMPLSLLLRPFPFSIAFSYANVFMFSLFLAGQIY
jgi:hypothetical protein